MKQINPWPIAITVFVTLFIVATVSFVFWSLKHRVDLVQPDYYEEELRYQDRIDSFQRTDELGTDFGLTFVSSTRTLAVQIPPGQTDAEGAITLYRPSDAKQDQDFALAVNESGQQTIDLNQLQKGMWRARLSWTSSTNEYYTELIVFVD